MRHNATELIHDESAEARADRHIVLRLEAGAGSFTRLFTPLSSDQDVAAVNEQQDGRDEKYDAQ